MTEYKNYCGKCKCEFYEKDLEYSHDFPKYLGGSDRDGRHLLCRDCHDRYENIVLREIFLKFFPERKLNIDEDRRSRIVPISQIKIFLSRNPQKQGIVKEIVNRIRRDFYGSK